MRINGQLNIYPLTFSIRERNCYKKYHVLSGKIDKKLKEQNQFFQNREVSLQVKSLYSSKITKARPSSSPSTNWDEQYEGGNTLLHLAVLTNDLPLIKILLVNEARIDIPNDHNETAYELALRTKNVEALEIFLKKYDVNMPMEKGFTILHKAIYYGNLQLIEWLLNHGANPYMRNDNDETPLTIAIKERRLNIVRWFINHVDSAMLYQLNNKDETPLHRAVAANDRRIVSFLLEKGADVNAQDIHGLTPLHIALKFNLRSIAEILIDNGADRGITDYYGDTPGMIALQRLSSDVLSTIYIDPIDLKRVWEIILFHMSSETEEIWAGSYYPIMHETIAKTFEQFALDFYKNEDFSKITDAFYFSARKNEERSIVQDIQSGEYVIMPVGWKRHFVTVIFYSGKVAICNRLENSYGKPSVVIYDLDVSKIDQDFIDEIYSTWLLSFREGEKYYYEELPQKIALNPNKYAFIDAKHAKFATCAMHSAKGALKVLLRDFYQDTVVADQVYKEWSTWVRIELLDRYLTLIKKEQLQVHEKIVAGVFLNIKKRLEEIHFDISYDSRRILVQKYNKFAERHKKKLIKLKLIDEKELF